jgi:hypothetical protein
MVERAIASPFFAKTLRMVLEIQKGLVCGDDCGVNFYQGDEGEFY